MNEPFSSRSRLSNLLHPWFLSGLLFYGAFVSWSASTVKSCVILILAAVCLLDAIKRSTQVISVENGILTQKDFHTQSSIKLSELASVHIGEGLGRFNLDRLTLEDRSGYQLTLRMDDHSYKSTVALKSIIGKYVLPGVQTNLSPDFFNPPQQIKEKPAVVLGRTVRSVFLRLFLPAAIITAAVVMWAITTNQPGW